MNYNISGIVMMILELFAMFDTAKVEIKKEHQLLMVSKTTSLRRARAKRDTSCKRKSFAALVKNPKVEPKPETKCFCNEGNGD